jgi:hypothetical protein
MMPGLINFMLFQLGWFACVLGGAHNYTVTGSITALAIIAYYVISSPTPAGTIRFLIAVTVIGAVFESLLVITDMAHYQYGQWSSYLAPYWMMLMWPVFATTINSSLSWLTALKTPLISLIAAITAPLAYYAGFKLGAVEFPEITLSLAIIAMSWAFLMPLVVYLSVRLQGPETSTKALLHGGSASHV